MKSLLKALMFAFLAATILIIVGLVILWVFSYSTRPTFEVHNTSQTTRNACEFRWRDEIHTVAALGPGEVHVFRVDSEGSMDIACTSDDGQKTVSGKVGYFTTGLSSKYTITVGEQTIESQLDSD